MPDSLRAALAENAIQLYGVLIFERDGMRVRSLRLQIAEALATSTDDSPTLPGAGGRDDIALGLKHGLLAPRSAKSRWATRHHRILLSSRSSVRRCCRRMPATNRAAFPFADRARARLAVPTSVYAGSRPHVVQLEDVADVRDQVNLPGMIDMISEWAPGNLR